MRAQFALPRSTPPAGLRTRVATRSAVALGLVVAGLRPGRIRRLLELIRTGASPATYDQARAAREAVVGLSTVCGGEGCVVRSIAVCLLCRFRGTWPTWRVGIRTEPFAAHAWVEAEGRIVDEPYPDGYFRPALTVGSPASRG